MFPIVQQYRFLLFSTLIFMIACTGLTENTDTIRSQPSRSATITTLTESPSTTIPSTPSKIATMPSITATVAPAITPSEAPLPTPTVVSPSLSTTTPLQIVNLPDFLNPDVNQVSSMVIVGYKNSNWSGVTALPENSAFSLDLFGQFYGPSSQSEELSRYISAAQPTLSPDGNFITLPGTYLFDTVNENLGSGSWLINTKNSEGQQILSQAVYGSWSPDSTQISFVLEGDLYKLNIANPSNPELLFTGKNLSPLFAHWSPDGEYIVVMERGLDTRDLRHWLVSSDGESAREISNLPVGLYHLTPDLLSWSFDSQYLLIQHQGAIIDVVNDQILDFPADGFVTWIPESHQLVANSSQGLFIRTVAGDPIVRVSNEPVTSFKVSDNSQKIAYSIRSGTDSESIYIFDLATQERTLINHVVLSRHQSIRTMFWNPENNVLIFDDFDSQTPIWFISTDPSSEAQVLTENGTLVGLYNFQNP